MKWVFLWIVIGISALAEPLPLHRVEISWKMQPGDDPRWAARDFDDSAWTEQSPGRTGPSVTWFRGRVTIPEGLPVAGALWFPFLPSQSEVYVNGRLALQYGIPGKWYTARESPVPLLALEGLRPGETMLLAMRLLDTHSSLPAWKPPLLGSREAVEAAESQGRLERLQKETGYLVLGLFNILFAVIALVSWRQQQDQPAYFWFAAAQLAVALFSIPRFAVRCLDVPFILAMPADMVYGVEMAAWLFLFREAPVRFEWKSHWWLLAAASVIFVPTAGTYLHAFSWLVFYLASISLTTWLIVMVQRVARRTSWLSLLFYPWLIYELGWLTWYCLMIAVESGRVDRIYNEPFALLAGPFEINAIVAGSALNMLAMGGILLTRFNRITRDKRSLEVDLEAAQQVQSLLVSSRSPETPGFAIETVYRPAQQVGGDFFQILPATNGGVLAAVGDVSGKGLRAALIVSLVIGVLRNRKSDAPGPVLEELNQALMGQTSGGFVNCCCALFDRVGGRVAIANAGHLAPCVDGHEVQIEAGLPLGVVAGMEYPESHVEGVRFTFVSDGVVEAANGEGELFGFERTRDLSGRPAGEIAEAACAWGQNDDITVVTVRRVSA